MEKTLVSVHDLKSDYSAKGKLKGVVIGWIIYLVFMVVTRIPEVQKTLIGISSELKFLTSNFWYFFAILMITGTIITMVKKHPYIKWIIYNTGIGFVDKSGTENYLAYDKIKLSYGKMGQSLIIELKEPKKASYNYAWKEFSQSDVLRNNLERYSQIYT